MYAVLHDQQRRNYVCADPQCKWMLTREPKRTALKYFFQRKTVIRFFNFQFLGTHQRSCGPPAYLYQSKAVDLAEERATCDACCLLHRSKISSCATDVRIFV